MIEAQCTANLDKYLFIDSKVSITDYSLNAYNVYNFISFLPKPFWQKRGLILLLKHPKVTFTQLPDIPREEQKEVLSKSELLNCLNPVTICNVLEQENAAWLQFFVKEHFDKKVPLGFNPMQDEEFLGKLIQYKLAILNHSGTSDMQARYILPVNTLLSNLLKFPDKLERVKTVFEKTQNNFFESFEVFELLCYLEQYDSIVAVESTLSRNRVKEIHDQRESAAVKRKQLYVTLSNLRAFQLDNFDRKQITFNLETLSQLNNQYLALKNE